MFIRGSDATAKAVVRSVPDQRGGEAAGMAWVWAARGWRLPCSLSSAPVRLAEASLAKKTAMVATASAHAAPEGGAGSLQWGRNVGARMALQRTGRPCSVQYSATLRLCLLTAAWLLA